MSDSIVLTDAADDDRPTVTIIAHFGTTASCRRFMRDERRHGGPGVADHSQWRPDCLCVGCVAERVDARSIALREAAGHMMTVAVMQGNVGGGMNADPELFLRSRGL